MIHVNQKTLQQVAIDGAKELGRKAGGAHVVVLLTTGDGFLAVHIENAPALGGVLMLQSAALQLLQQLANEMTRAPQVKQ